MVSPKAARKRRALAVTGDGNAGRRRLALTQIVESLS
jgi:hypothetical protein